MLNLESLHEKLEKINQYPVLYMFKFIVPVNNKNIARVESLFEPSATIYHNESRNGKYISITAKQKMETSEDIVEVYQKASKIQSIIAL